MLSAGYATVSRPSVCLWRSDTVITCWNSSQIISRLISLRYLLRLTPTWAIWSSGNTPKLGWNRGGVKITKKPAIYLKCCKVGPMLLWRTNRKSHTRFRLVLKSMTLNSRNVNLAEIKKNYWAHQIHLNEHRPILSAAKYNFEREF